MRTTLPPLYRIDLKEEGNTVVQLAAPSQSFGASVTPHTKDRVKGFILNPDVGGPEILVITNSASSPAAFTHVLRLRGDVAAPTSSDPLDLTAGRWERHPDQAPPPATAAEYESHAIATRDTWHGAFSYRQEDVARKVEGLRPPQIGAIHAIQSHWTASSEPATVVLPTGVGKTETMLSTFIVEQCHRLLVVGSEPLGHRVHALGSGRHVPRGREPDARPDPGQQLELAPAVRRHPVEASSHQGQHPGKDDALPDEYTVPRRSPGFTRQLMCADRAPSP